MLAQRLAAKKMRRFDEADSLQADLRRMGVEVDDRTLEWRVAYSTAFGEGPLHDYERDPTDEIEIDEKTLSKINSLLGKRLAFKKKREFGKADNLQSELRTRYGVEVSDKALSWRIAYDNPRGATQKIDLSRAGLDMGEKPYHDYIRAETDYAELDEATIHAVDLLLSERLKAKKSRNFDRADAIQDQLRDELGIHVDDRKLEWHYDKSSTGPGASGRRGGGRNSRGRGPSRGGGGGGSRRPNLGAKPKPSKPQIAAPGSVGGSFADVKNDRADDNGPSMKVSVMKTDAGESQGKRTPDEIFAEVRARAAADAAKKADAAADIEPAAAAETCATDEPPAAHPDCDAAPGGDAPAAADDDPWARRLNTAVMDHSEASWREHVSERLVCWFIGLPMPTQRQLGGCIGALGLHLGSRLDSAWRAAQFAIGRTPAPMAPTPAPMAPTGAAEGGCEWLPDAFDNGWIKLPDTPAFPSTSDFTLPPIPRLLPSWQQLQSLTPAKLNTPAAASFNAAIAPTHQQASSMPSHQQASLLTQPASATEQPSASVGEMAASTALAFGGGAGGGLLLGVGFMYLVRKHGRTSLRRANRTTGDAHPKSASKSAAPSS